MSVFCFEELLAHVGHKIVCVAYGREHEYEGDPENVAVECETCGEVLLDFNRPEEEQE